MKATYITVSIMLLVALVGAQDYCPTDMPPAGIIASGDPAQYHDWYVSASTDSDPAVYVARVELVTGGLTLNWMTDAPPWSLDPVPDSLYLWEEGYGAYCRHLSGGTDRTRLEWCATDCISMHPYIPGAVVYQWVQWDGGWQDVVVQMMLLHTKEIITPHSVAGRANHD